MADLADEVLGQRPGSTEVAARALERLRRRLHCTQAVMWIVTDAGIRRAVHVADIPSEASAAEDDVVDGAMAIERLRRNGTIVCRLGEVSGVEGLVPAGVQSFLATAATRRGEVAGVLVLGWADAVPPCSETSGGHLRFAATLLATTIIDADRTSDQPSLHEAVLASLSDRIAVVDRHGTIVAVNAAWTEFGLRMGLPSHNAIGPGVSYAAACRHVADAGCPDAADALEGIEGVLSGALDRFATAYRFRVLGQERWFEMRVTPLRRPEGGAVIAHADVTSAKSAELARSMGDRLFHDLVDTVALPIWIVAPDGRVIYANPVPARASHGERRGVHPPTPETSASLGASGDASWLQIGHPEDRDAAMSTFRAAAARGERFDLEVRLPAADGKYRWWLLSGMPRLALDGRLDRYVVVGIDTTVLREARRMLGEARAKLVAAQEAERSRIARELHDDFGQQLALLASRLDAVGRSHKLSRNLMLSGLTDARKGLQDLARSVHHLSYELHPGKLKLLGLGPTLDGLCRSIQTESGARITFDSIGLSADVSEDRALCVFRVAQEALQNAVKHSGARNIQVHVAATASELTLRISDDGTGFDQTLPRPKGLGLLTMRERVELMGGTLTIETGRGSGTTIDASVPVTDVAGAAL